jgi:hypothetical protein
MINEQRNNISKQFIISLAQKIRPKDFVAAEQKIKQEAHPTEDMLFDYVQNAMSEEDSEVLRAHLLSCKSCADEESIIREIDRESDQAILDWAASPPERPLLVERAFRLMELFKNTPSELQKFIREIGAKKLAALALSSTPKSQSDKDITLLNMLWDIIKTELESLSHSVPQTRYAKSSRAEEVHFVEFDGNDLQGAMNLTEEDNAFFLSGYYSINKSDKILILNLPDSYIVFDPKRAMHIFPDEEKIRSVGLQKDGDDFEFYDIALSRKIDLNTISYEISEPYLDEES